MNSVFKYIVIVLLMTVSFNKAFAAFPQDFEDVVWIEGLDISDWPVTSELRSVSVVGDFIILDYDKTNVWPPSIVSGFRVNAVAWGFVFVEGEWRAGTWEYMGVGQIAKQKKGFGGCCHFRAGIGNFTPQNGTIYGFMVSGIQRDGSLVNNNVIERTNLVLYKWGEGMVDIPDLDAPLPNLNGLLPLLLEDTPR